MPTTADMLTVAEAAEELGLSPITIRRAVMLGTLTVERLNGRTYLIPRSEVERYEREHRGQRGRQGKRPRTDNPPKHQQYQRDYYQRRKAARRQEQQPATEPAENEETI